MDIAVSYWIPESPAISTNYRIELIHTTGRDHTNKVKGLGTGSIIMIVIIQKNRGKKNSFEGGMLTSPRK